MSVVYFDQRLGAVHSKRWWKSSFLTFLVLKNWKNETSKILYINATFNLKIDFLWEIDELIWKDLYCHFHVDTEYNLRKDN